ncbi:hypothetical protein FSB78_10010 [Sphingomonas ginsenosidivorax]|uniref:Uncharacterized protein n=1 Tax=Sphingomonas ginsenosidivorax TaxID=862135 RepID=A0A5C6UFK0_9SPHN|nr:hypothetical protein [Sphingomonas ginsenosidivorax]TXC71244.1 hypothetical protein FSB78_10010 [Sphingomonas ginsenosidivorax]
MPTDPNTDLERETTGEPYVDGNIETEEGVSPGGSSVEDTDAVSNDTPDSIATDADDVDDGADSLSIRGDD